MIQIGSSFGSHGGLCLAVLDAENQGDLGLSCWGLRADRTWLGSDWAPQTEPERNSASRMDKPVPGGGKGGMPQASYTPTDSYGSGAKF